MILSRYITRHLFIKYIMANGKKSFAHQRFQRYDENILVDMRRLASLNWHKLTETKRSSHLGTLEGFHRRLKATDMSLGKVAEGEVFPSHWQGIGSLRKRTVKLRLILTKPLQGRMECLRNHVRHLVRASLIINGRGRRTGVDSPRWRMYLLYMGNVKSKLATGLPTPYAPYPPARKAESCAKRVEYKWTLEPRRRTESIRRSDNKGRTRLETRQYS